MYSQLANKEIFYRYKTLHENKKRCCAGGKTFNFSTKYFISVSNNVHFASYVEAMIRFVLYQSDLTIFRQPIKALQPSVDLVDHIVD